MAYATLQRRGSVGLVTLNRPERLNAISRSLTRDLHAVFAEANADPEIGVIVWTGEGRAFCAGDDLKEFELQAASSETIEEHIDGIQQITRDVMFSSKPVIGAIHGFAVGGGFEWLLNCDLVVAAEDLVCFFPEMDWGQFVTGAVTHLLPLAVGHQRTMELILLGERQSADALASMGFVNRVVKGEDVLQTAFSLADKIGTKSAYAVGKLKRLLNEGGSNALARALAQEHAITVEAFKQPDAAHRARSFKR